MNDQYSVFGRGNANQCVPGLVHSQRLNRLDDRNWTRFVPRLLSLASIPTLIVCLLLALFPAAGARAQQQLNWVVVAGGSYTPANTNPIVIQLWRLAPRMRVKFTNTTGIQGLQLSVWQSGVKVWETAFASPATREYQWSPDPQFLNSEQTIEIRPSQVASVTIVWELAGAEPTNDVIGNPSGGGGSGGITTGTGSNYGSGYQPSQWYSAGGGGAGNFSRGVMPESTYSSEALRDNVEEINNSPMISGYIVYALAIFFGAWIAAIFAGSLQMRKRDAAEAAKEGKAGRDKARTKTRGKDYGVD